MIDKPFFRSRYLPHLYFNEGIYFITYRLANSIPYEKLTQINTCKTNWNFDEFSSCFINYDSLLDSEEFDKKYLKQKDIAEICKSTLHFPDGKDYKLICYCIMPNHIHLLFELLPNNKDISKIMQSIKGISSKKCNRLLNRVGQFWQDESYDRWIRDDKELYFVIKYVLSNPVKAGLVKDWNDWEYTYCHPDYIVL